MPVGNHTLPTEMLSGCDSGFFVCLGNWASTVTTGAFWIMAIISFQVILFLGTQRYGSTRAFGFSAIIGLFMGVWLSIIGFLAWWAGSMFIIIGVIGLAALFMQKN